MVNLYQKILSMPFVYNHVRPWVLGGIDLSPVYDGLEVTEDDTVLDIGCGTGDALTHLHTFRRYVGADVDSIAIASAARTHGNDPRVEFMCKLLTREDVEAIQPTVVVMAGLLHHLTDEESVDMLKMACTIPSVRRAATLDIVYLDSAEHMLSNALAALDRGRFCRQVEQYRDLVRRAGVRLVSDDLIWGDNKRKRARYFTMSLVG